MNNDKEQRIAIEWLQFANGDLKSAKVLLAAEDIPLRNVCYLSQQSVEKALKALLIRSKINVIKTHDLDLLRNKLPEDKKVLFCEFDLSWLSEWSVEARYPGDWPEASPLEAERAVKIAESIIDIISLSIRKTSDSALD